MNDTSATTMREIFHIQLPGPSVTAESLVQTDPAAALQVDSSATLNHQINSSTALHRPIQHLAEEDYIVDWDGPDDPAKPCNFSRGRKWTITLMTALLTLTVAFSSAIFSPATTVTAEEYGTSTEVMLAATSLFVLGLAVGPIIWGPLSELYGRKIPVFVSFAMFAILQVPVAVARGPATIIVFRFFQGLTGSAPIVVPGGILSDIWSARERGFAVPWFAGGLFAGPLLAPLIGAAIVESSLGWRWTQWITLIATGVLGLISLIVMPETFGPLLLARKAKHIRVTTHDWAAHAKLEERTLDLRAMLENYISRPLRMLVLEPILALVTLYLAFIYGLLYLFFEAFAISYQGQRGWGPVKAGLPFIPVLIGVLLACVLISSTTNTRLAPDYAAGRMQETRLLLMAVGGMLLPCGLFWFAWTSDPDINPWPQLLSGVLLGMGNMLITMQGLNYAVDCYTINAASAFSAMALVRSSFGAGFPMFATYLYDGLGVSWATSLLGFISIALLPVPILFYQYGAKIRTWSKYVSS